MNRRTFLCGLTLGALAAPLAAGAQQPGKVARVGYLALLDIEPMRPAALRAGLRELGWSEGQNLIIDYRSADGKPARLTELAAQLVRLKLDVLVGQASPEAQALMRATKTIPSSSVRRLSPSPTVWSRAWPGQVEMLQDHLWRTSQHSVGNG